MHAGGTASEGVEGGGARCVGNQRVDPNRRPDARRRLRCRHGKGIDNDWNEHARTAPRAHVPREHFRRRCFQTKSEVARRELDLK